MRHDERSAEEGRHRGDESHLLREVMRIHQILMAGFSRQVGMPASQLAVMRLLAISEDGLGVMELARQLGINPAAVTRLLQEMERNRLILRRADPRDRRRSYVRLSSRGLKAFEEIHARSHELERSLDSVIGPEDLAAARRALAKMRTYLEGLR
ncbi:MAG: MarR family transcriptional regulator [bacterium]